MLCSRIPRRGVGCLPLTFTPVFLPQRPSASRPFRCRLPLPSALRLVLQHLRFPLLRLFADNGLPDQLVYYTGNYSTYVRTKTENEVNQMKAYHKQQEEIAHIKKFIASAGTYANLVKQAKSKQKVRAVTVVFPPRDHHLLTLICPLLFHTAYTPFRVYNFVPSRY